MGRWTNQVPKLPGRDQPEGGEFSVITGQDGRLGYPQFGTVSVETVEQLEGMRNVRRYGGSDDTMPAEWEEDYQRDDTD